MLKVLIAIMWLIVVVLVVGRFSTWKVPLSGPAAISHHTGLTIEQIKSLACLITTRVEVADVQETVIRGYTGGLKAAIIVKGDFLLGTDLSKAQLTSIDPTAKTAVLHLPPPTVTSPRVDHARTRIFAVARQGLWQFAPREITDSEVLDQAFQEAQKLVAGAAASQELVARSRQQAENVLSTFFEMFGWRVSIRWNSGHRV